MNDDADLLRRYAEDRSEAAFTAWVQRHFDLVYSAALRRLWGDHHRARDVAQMVFVDAARKAGSLCRHPSLVGWLYTSTHFAAQKLIRSESRRQIREEAAHAMQSISSSPDPAPAWADLRPLLDAEMLALGSADRTAILLRYFEQRPLAEVGSQLGLSENAARMRVDRALAKLRRRLARHGVTSTAAALGAALAGNAVMASPAGLSAAVAGSSLVEVAALAAAGAAGAGAAVQLMASKLTIGVVAASSLLALGSGVYYEAQARAARQSGQLLGREAAQFEAGLRALPARQAGEEERIAAMKAARERPPVPRPEEPPEKPAPVAADALNREIAENPKLRQALGQDFLARYRLKYAPLAKAMGLSDAQLGQLSVGDLRMRADLFDLEQAARLMGLDPATNGSLGGLEQRVRDAHTEAVRAMIGEDGMRQFQEYDRSYAVRDIANQVAAATFYSTTPLTSGQADVLTRLLASSNPTFQRGGEADLDTVDWDGALAQAAGVLPPGQVAALRAVRAQLDLRRLADAARAGKGDEP